MPLPHLKTDEIISTLQRTSLKTILVEGTADQFVLRRLEERFDETTDIIECNGRPSLLEIFSRKDEFYGSKVAFLADKDMFLFQSIPTNYTDIIWTNGYCIENDIYHGSSLDRLLTTEEKINHDKLIHTLSRWFAFEVNKCLCGEEFIVSHNIHKICDLNNFSLCQELIDKINDKEPPEELLADIRNNFKLKVRGKTLFESLVFFLSSSKRRSKYSYYNLLELGLTDNNTLIEQIVDQVAAKLI